MESPKFQQSGARITLQSSSRLEIRQHHSPSIHLYPQILLLLKSIQVEVPHSLSLRLSSPACVQVGSRTVPRTSLRCQG